MIGTGPFKGEHIHVGQLSFYAQDELLATDRLKLTYGLRVDMPMYFTDPVDNPFSRGLTALDENGKSEDGRSEQASWREADGLATSRIQLECGWRQIDAGSRWNRNLHGTRSVRVGWKRHLESGQQSQPRPTKCSHQD